MSKKVSELTKELDITLLELKDYASKMGIEITGAGTEVTAAAGTACNGGTSYGIWGFTGTGYAVIDDSKERRHILMDREGRELYSVPYSTEDETGETRFNNILPPAENGCFWTYSYTVSKPGNYRKEDMQYTLMRVVGDRVDVLTEQAFDDVLAYVEDANCGQQDEDFAEGLQAVSRDGKWGYIDENGLIAVDFQWDAAANFYHGLALVEKDGKLSYIDRGGAAVWQEK